MKLCHLGAKTFDGGEKFAGFQFPLGVAFDKLLRCSYIHDSRKSLSISDNVMMMHGSMLTEECGMEYSNIVAEMLDHQEYFKSFRLSSIVMTMSNEISGDEDMRSVTSKKSQFTYQSNQSSSGEGSESRSETASDRQVYFSTTFGKREEANVLRARALVALILVLAATGVATATHLLVKQQERKEFETQFAGQVTQIVTVSLSRANQFYDALDSFASSIGAQAAAEHRLLNTRWPFYTVPEYSVQAQKLAQLTGVDNPLIGLAPLVQEDDREQWNSYAAEQNPIWYQESIENEGYTEFTVKDLVNLTIPFVHLFDPENGFLPTPVRGPGEALPLFQQYPVGLILGSPIMLTNMDGIRTSEQTAEIFRITQVTRRPTLGFARIEDGSGTTIPGSQIVQPIFDGADTKAEGRSIVAVLVIRLPWLDYFKNVFAEGEDGIVVVLESACPKLPDDALHRKVNLTESDRYIITYQVDGPNAVLLGEADLHDPQYDALVVSEALVDLGIDQSQLPEGSCVPVVTMHVYPSVELEDSFQTDNATIYTVTVIVIFVFTSLVFLLYDFSVGRRQRTVMDRITKQDRIVSDVFPTAIRDRLYENQAKNMMKGDDNEADDGPLGLDETFYGKSSAIGSAPLADLFPSVTVVFADLVGFTAWSSAREPHQVFILLETIFGAFDKLAYRHNVFKIETVGDCYVAATGLPEPTEDHAVVACRFARECLRKMKDVTLKLEVSLGPDTSDLELRTGIHR
eukprot:scaffold735_cov116-Cylindrotheca_fusiformis.AAC.2